MQPIASLATPFTLTLPLAVLMIGSHLPHVSSSLRVHLIVVSELAAVSIVHFASANSISVISAIAGRETPMMVRILVVST